MLYDLIICEDEPAILAGLCSQIDWNGLGFSLKAVFSDAQKALDFLTVDHADAVLTDIVMEGLNGIDLAKWIHEHAPGTKIVVLSGHARFEYAQISIQYGVYRYLLKPTRHSELTETFRALAQDLAAEAQTSLREEEPDDVLKTVYTYTVENLRENIPMAVMAEKLHYNQSYFSRMFKQQNGGVGYTEFVMQIKMEQARKILEKGKKSVSEAAEAVGYSDISRFSKNFFRCIGVKPSHYLRHRMEGH